MALLLAIAFRLPPPSPPQLGNEHFQAGDNPGAFFPFSFMNEQAAAAGTGSSAVVGGQDPAAAVRAADSQRAAAESDARLAKLGPLDGWRRRLLLLHAAELAGVSAETPHDLDAFFRAWGSEAAAAAVSDEAAADASQDEVESWLQASPLVPALQLHRHRLLNLVLPLLADVDGEPIFSDSTSNPLFGLPAPPLSRLLFFQRLLLETASSVPTFNMDVFRQRKQARDSGEEQDADEDAGWVSLLSLMPMLDFVNFGGFGEANLDCYTHSFKRSVMHGSTLREEDAFRYVCDAKMDIWPGEQFLLPLPQQVVGKGNFPLLLFYGFMDRTAPQLLRTPFPLQRPAPLPTFRLDFFPNRGANASGEPAPSKQAAIAQLRAILRFVLADADSGAASASVPAAASSSLFRQLTGGWPGEELTDENFFGDEFGFGSTQPSERIPRTFLEVTRRDWFSAEDEEYDAELRRRQERMDATVQAYNEAKAKAKEATVYEKPAVAAALEEARAAARNATQAFSDFPPRLLTKLSSLPIMALMRTHCLLEETLPTIAAAASVLHAHESRLQALAEGPAKDAERSRVRALAVSAVRAVLGVEATPSADGDAIAAAAAAAAADSEALWAVEAAIALRAGQPLYAGNEMCAIRAIGAQVEQSYLQYPTSASQDMQLYSLAEEDAVGGQWVCTERLQEALRLMMKELPFGMRLPLSPPLHSLAGAGLGPFDSFFTEANLSSLLSLNIPDTALLDRSFLLFPEQTEEESAALGSPQLHFSDHVPKNPARRLRSYNRLAMAAEELAFDFDIETVLENVQTALAEDELAGTAAQDPTRLGLCESGSTLTLTHKNYLLERMEEKRAMEDVLGRLWNLFDQVVNAILANLREKEEDRVQPRNLRLASWKLVRPTAAQMQQGSVEQPIGPIEAE